MKSPISWFEKFFSRDRRGAERRESPPLIAYYWDGAAPRAHEIRDISPCGLFVKTEERWYPGTLVRLILQRTDSSADTSERSIAILAKAVRWGADGVGLASISSEPGNGNPGWAALDKPVDKKALDAFLGKLRNRNDTDDAGCLPPIPTGSWTNAPRCESYDIQPQGERVNTTFYAANEGNALVEFALCLPILMLILTGIATFGFALNNYLELTNAMQIGAQQVAVSQNSTTDPCNTVVAAVYQAAPYLTQSQLKFTTTIYTSPTASTAYPGTSCSSGSTTTGAAGNLTPGYPVQVTATYPCSLSVYGVNYVPGCLLHAQVTEIVQ
jgi:Flp pilus assembly protein TadG